MILFLLLFSIQSFAETIYFHTTAGDFGFLLEKKVAPNHAAQISELAELGVFDGVPFTFAEKNYFVQLGDQYDRDKKLLPVQKNAIRNLKPELSDEKIREGVVTLTPIDKKTGRGETAITFFMGDAEDQTGTQVVLGNVTLGLETLKRITKMPTSKDDSRLQGETRVISARTMDDDQAAIQYQNAFRLKSAETKVQSLPWIMAMILVLSILTFFLTKKASVKTLVSLHMLSGLIAGFVLLSVLSEAWKGKPLLGALLFSGLVLMFKFMNRFEST